MKRWIVFTAVAVVIVAVAVVGVTMVFQTQVPEELYFTILHTNDEHSAVIPHSPAVDYSWSNGTASPDDYTIGGFARLAYAVDEIRGYKQEMGEPVLLFNAGDFIGGSAFGWLAPHGSAVELGIMQEIGYDAVCIGNHEFDYGTEVLANYLLAAGYPEAHAETLVLATNVMAPPGHPIAENDLFRETGIFELDYGIKVGVFSLIGEKAIETSPDTGTLEFADQHETARKAVQELKDQGADIIVALTHAGLEEPGEEDQNLAREVTGIDIIIGGHCHTALYEPLVVNGTIIVQAGSHLRYLGFLELAYNLETKELRIRNNEEQDLPDDSVIYRPEWQAARPFLVALDSTVPSHEEITALVLDYKAELDRLIGEMTDGRFDDILGVVARSGFEMPHARNLKETLAGNFVTDAMRLVTEEVTGERVDVAFIASGAVRKSIVPGQTEHARDNLSFYDLTEVAGLGYGFDGNAGYPIVSIYVTGDELRRFLEVMGFFQVRDSVRYFGQFSGIRYSYNPETAFHMGERAVVKAELYAGDGLQPMDNGGNFVPLEWGDEKLYRVVTDFSALGLVVALNPHFQQKVILPKNAAGEPLPQEEWQQFIVHQDDGRELKVWETVVRHAASLPAGDDDGVPRVPDYYQNTGRIIRVVN